MVTRSSAASTSAGGSPRPSPPIRIAIGPTGRRRTAAGRRAARSPRSGSRVARASAIAVGGRLAARSAAAARCPSIRAAPSSRTGSRACAGRDDAGRAAGFGDAHDRADVARILDVDGDDDQRGVRARTSARPVGAGRSASATMRARRSHRAQRVHHRRAMTVTTSTPARSSAATSDRSRVVARPPST